MENAIKIRNVLFKTFIINYAMIILAWLIATTDIYTYLMKLFHNTSNSETELLILSLIGTWKILAAAFFLIPAIAIHWEYMPNKRKKHK